MPSIEPLTKYHAALRRVLNEYPPGSPSLLYGIEAVLKTAMENVEQKSKATLANETCQGMHIDPPKNVICRQCFDALEQGRVDLTDGEDRPVETKSEQDERDAVTKQVLGFLKSGHFGDEE